MNFLTARINNPGLSFLYNVSFVNLQVVTKKRGDVKILTFSFTQRRGGELTQFSFYFYLPR